MNHKLRNTIIKYSIGITICGGFTFLILGIRGVFGNEPMSTEKIYLALTDAFTIPGALFILFGLLVFLTNKGSLNAIGWSLKRFFLMFIPGMGSKAQETYKEYRERKRPLEGYEFLYVVGFLFLAVGIIFLILFYNVYNG